MYQMLNTRTLATRLLPTAPGLRLDRVTIGSDEILATLVATQPRSACPVCGRLAQSVHSSYQRTLTSSRPHSHLGGVERLRQLNYALGIQAIHHCTTLTHSAWPAQEPLMFA
jgi:hypothetical protein